MKEIQWKSLRGASGKSIHSTGMQPWLTSFPWPDLKRYSRWNTPHEAVKYTCENQSLTLQETDLKPGASGSDDTPVPICEWRVSHAFMA